jgi:hypothetical protein
MFSLPYHREVLFSLFSSLLEKRQPPPLSWIVGCLSYMNVSFPTPSSPLEMDTVSFMEQQLVALYVLLPATKDPSVDLLKRALREMYAYYDSYEIGRRIRWFYYILRRTDTMTEEAKEIIKEELMIEYSYKELLEDDPIAREVLASRAREAEAKGLAEGRAGGREEGRAEGIAIGEERARAQILVQTQAQIRQKILASVIERYPELVGLANAIVASIGDVDALLILMVSLAQAQTTEDAKQVLLSAVSAA